MGAAPRLAALSEAGAIHQTCPPTCGRSLCVGHGSSAVGFFTHWRRQKNGPIHPSSWVNAIVHE